MTRFRDWWLRNGPVVIVVIYAIRFIMTPHSDGPAWTSVDRTKHEIHENDLLPNP